MTAATNVFVLVWPILGLSPLIWYSLFSVHSQQMWREMEQAGKVTSSGSWLGDLNQECAIFGQTRVCGPKLGRLIVITFAVVLLSRNLVPLA